MSISQVEFFQEKCYKQNHKIRTLEDLKRIELDPSKSIINLTMDVWAPDEQAWDKKFTEKLSAGFFRYQALAKAHILEDVSIKVDEFGYTVVFYVLREQKLNLPENSTRAYSPGTDCHEIRIFIPFEGMTFWKRLRIQARSLIMRLFNVVK